MAPPMHPLRAPTPHAQYAALSTNAEAERRSVPSRIGKSAALAPVAAVLALAACQPAEPVQVAQVVAPPAVAAPPPRTVEGDLTYNDTPGFDRALSGELAASTTPVNVNVNGAADLDHLPERIERWLSAVRQSGGRVRARPLSEPGNPRPGLTVDMQVRLVDTRPDRDLFDIAREYNTVVHYVRGSGRVDRLEFTRRQPLR
ncbi:MAG TPA: hypothetical protein VEY95_11690 [Azospirillaceae bacterium]|nr:hypothetical protein [Azospirillaceae bacterium]